MKTGIWEMRTPARTQCWRKDGAQSVPVGTTREYEHGSSGEVPQLAAPAQLDPSDAVNSRSRECGLYTRRLRAGGKFQVPMANLQIHEEVLKC